MPIENIRIPEKLVPSVATTAMSWVLYILIAAHIVLLVYLATREIKNRDAVQKWLWGLVIGLLFLSFPLAIRYPQLSLLKFWGRYFAWWLSYILIGTSTLTLVVAICVLVERIIWPIFNIAILRWVWRLPRRYAWGMILGVIAIVFSLYAATKIAINYPLPWPWW